MKARMSEFQLVNGFDNEKNRGLPTLSRAEYICQVDIDQCNGCRECMNLC
jgi:hypothetical protein